MGFDDCSRMLEGDRRLSNYSAFCFLGAPHHNGSVDRLSVFTDAQFCIKNSCGPNPDLATSRGTPPAYEESVGKFAPNFLDDGRFDGPLAGKHRGKADNAAPRVDALDDL